MTENNPIREEMLSVLAKQRDAHIKAGAVPLSIRQDRIDRAISILENNGQRFIEY